MTVGVVIGAVTLGGVSFAATGGNLLLGRTNSASSQTLLSNSGSGPVLALSTKSGQPPIAVSSTSGKATNLNADKLDGLDSTQLARASATTGTITATGVGVDLDGDGIADAAAAEAVCPAGTVVTGGGDQNLSSQQSFESYQSGVNTWTVLTLLDPADTPDMLKAIATCYRPQGGSAPGLTYYRAKTDNRADLRAAFAAKHR